MGSSKSGDGGGDSSAMMAMMQAMQSQQSGVETPHMPEAPHMPAAPEPLKLPEIQKPLEIDWTEQNDQLSAKARADFHNDQTSKKGRLDTVLTSPLLDDDEVDVTQSLLKGS